MIVTHAEQKIWSDYVKLGFQFWIDFSGCGSVDMMFNYRSKPWPVAQQAGTPKLPSTSKVKLTKKHEMTFFETDLMNRIEQLFSSSFTSVCSQVGAVCCFSLCCVRRYNCK